MKVYFVSGSNRVKSNEEGTEDVMVESDLGTTTLKQIYSLFIL